MTSVEYARDTARFLQGYSKRYHAGAFATPTAKEIAGMNSAELVDERVGGVRCVIVRKRLRRDSVRKDFTGRSYGLAAGSLLVTHAAHDGADSRPFPPALLRDADYVMAYAEDPALTHTLSRSGRSVTASRVTAAAEVINCWGPAGLDGDEYPGYDRATITPMPLEVPETLRASVEAEVTRLQGWDDDFPYYSDGSWSSLSLKGFWPDDPARGVKPSEMPKSWKAEHRADLGRPCEWTSLAGRTPGLMEFVRSVPWWGNTERVRLLQMSGRGGAGGRLGRHTDITDRDSGTRDGHITRFHVPLVTDPAIRLHAWELDGRHVSAHLSRWGCFYLDARKPHAVVNPTGVDRIHLVVDVVTDGSVRDLIGSAYRASPDNDVEG